MESKLVAIAALFIASLLTLMRAYVAIKLGFIALFLFVAVMTLAVRKISPSVHPRLAWFYLWLSCIGLIWAVIGLIHGNSVQAITDSVRLYVFWNIGFAVLFTILRSLPSLKIMHSAMVLGGILVPLINLAGLLDQASGYGLIPESVVDELGLQVGFGEGYFQMGGSTIISMFLIAPYLMSLQFRKDAAAINSKSVKLALILSLIVVALSGRRALWLVIALTPFLILFLSRITKSQQLLRQWGRRILVTSTAAFVIGLGLLWIVPESALEDVGSMNRLKNAFSSEDARSIQKPYLVEAFLQHPALGSGFGGFSKEYKRDEDHPWSYELTYYQLLMNLGLVGTAFIMAIFSVCFMRVVKLLRQFKTNSAVPFGLLIAFTSLLIGAYSNPYFGGFDSLFFAGLLPFLSTFTNGWEPIPIPSRNPTRFRRFINFAHSGIRQEAKSLVQPLNRS